MKIAAAHLAMQSQHQSAVRQETRESLRVQVAARAPAPQTPPPVQISDSGRAAQSAEIQAAADAAAEDPFLRLIKSMIEMLTGRAVRVFDSRSLQAAGNAADAPPRQEEAPAARPAANVSIDYQAQAVYEETETTSFSAQGVVRTADGRSINFSLDLEMARHFQVEIDVSLRTGQRQDPLVVNFAGTAAELSNRRFDFDLNGDGRSESIPMLAEGHGYLALDRNGNDQIDSGAELFGPQSGAGFTELAQHDQDGNAWIDENDAVFERLRLWTPDGNGGGRLASLREQGIGALFLGHLATPFELRGQGNSDLGAVRASSIYLTEAGQAGTMQEIDLTV